MNSSAPIDSDQADVLDSVGHSLRRAREEQSKSRDDAAQEINLRLDQLDALEHDQFDRLPGDAFVRGYLRTYSRWLKLDVDQILADYIKQTGASESVSLTADLHKRRPVSSGNDNAKIVSAAIVVGLFILGFWLYNANSESVVEPTVVGNETTVDTFSGEPLEESNLDETNIDTAELAGDSAQFEAGTTNSADQSEWQNPFTTAAEPTSNAPAGVDTNAAQETTAATATIAPAPATVAPAATTTAQQAASASTSSNQTVFSSGITTRGSGPDEALFHFKEDCWIEVKDNDGRKLYSAARKAGQSLLLKGKAPLYVVVGNAPAVALTFNGKDVEVRSRNRRNSARLTLRSNR